MAVTEAVAEKDRQLFGARLLAVLARAVQAHTEMGEALLRFRVNAKRDIFDMVLALGEPYVGEVVESWYRAEPDPDLRAVVTDESLSWWLRPEWAERRQRILKLASRDWKAEIAEKARSLLKQQ